MSNINENGLTWAQWYAAATLGGKHTPCAESARVSAHLRAEWRTGVDPTEWAAHFEQGGKVFQETTCRVHYTVWIPGEPVARVFEGSGNALHFINTAPECEKWVNLRIFEHNTKPGYHTPSCMVGYVNRCGLFVDEFLSIPAVEEV